MALANLQHLFVLMLENRSFDHVFGFSQIQGKDAITSAPRTAEGLTGDERLVDDNGKIHAVKPDAKFTIDDDLPHEFADVKLQICGRKDQATPYAQAPINNSGYLSPRTPKSPPNLTDAILSFKAQDLPILNTLAREFVVCDRWFSSIPGPTIPNRMFAHAATSGGLSDSPTYADFVKHQLFGYHFNRGHIFGKLRQKGIPWAIYVHDVVENMSIMMEGIRRTELRDFDLDFTKDVQKESFSPKYVFIEPKYDGLAGHYKRGNSMHPLNNASEGERLIKKVYETLRLSPHWESSALVVVFDEHGGFYDHVPPPKTADAPADGHVDPENHFDFTVFGPRVPALIISPLIPKNLIDHTQYDHASILRTLSDWLGTTPLTERDKRAHSFAHLFSLDAARNDAPIRLPTLPARPEAPEEPPRHAPLPRSAEPFLIAAAIAKAKRSGPDSFDQIAHELNSLDNTSTDAAKEFAAKARREVLAPLPEGAAPTITLSGVLREKKQITDMLEQDGGDRAKLAWRLGITQAELAEHLAESPQ